MSISISQILVKIYPFSIFNSVHFFCIFRTFHDRIQPSFPVTDPSNRRKIFLSKFYFLPTLMHRSHPWFPSTPINPILCSITTTFRNSSSDIFDSIEQHLHQFPTLFLPLFLMITKTNKYSSHDDIYIYIYTHYNSIPHNFPQFSFPIPVNLPSSPR